ncbi:hypothetical protein [Rhodopseudomonas parapalustris]
MAVIGSTVVTLLSACSDNTPLSLRTDQTPVYQFLGTQRFSIPTNYLVSRDVGSVLVVATWPELQGRSRSNYKHYLDSNISIYVSSGNIHSLQSVYRVYVQEAWGFKNLTPNETSRMSDFDGYVLRHPKSDASNPHATLFDIYLKRSPSGEYTAIIRCDGKASQGIPSPQCQYWTVYPEFPNLLFHIGFSRTPLLDQVTRVDDGARGLFLKFNADGERAYKDDPDARDALQHSEQLVRDARGKK